jgi:iron complex outermembrane receptor protein
MPTPTRPLRRLRRAALLGLGAATSLLPTLALADERGDCLAKATTQADVNLCPPEAKEVDVAVRAKPQPRSASEWESSSAVLRAAPHASGAEMLSVSPGVFVGDKGLPGRAPHLSLRGFDGTSGQDVAIHVGTIPLNQVSHSRAPGYADMRLVMPEVVRSLRIAHGPYDPRQGDFAVAGSLHMDLGLPKPGFYAKGGYGAFGARRVFLAFAPDDRHFTETFAAFATDAVDGPSGVRAGERSSFVGQVGGGERMVLYRATIAMGSARFDFPGYLPERLVRAGGDPYAATGPVGRDRTSQALLGADVIWEVGEGTLGMGAYAGKTKTSFHQNLTGYLLDVAAGGAPEFPDDSEQVNDAATFGLNLMYRRQVDLTTPRDAIEVGMTARVDSIAQTDTRLFADGTIHERPVDATIDATGVGAYADLALYPMRRVVLRGGPRLDSLSFAVADHTSSSGLERTSQGFHLGNKAMIDVALGSGAHAVASYGEGFRSPEARELEEGERVPFATVRAVEGGLRFKQAELFRASVAVFGSWLDHDRIFDATARSTLPAPASTRVGAATAFAVQAGPFGANAALTYARATFDASGGSFREGELVPYAPTVVLRNDLFLVGSLGKIGSQKVTGRLGAGLLGAAGRALPGGAEGADTLTVDALGALGYRGFELAVHGTNLLDRRNYDSQYVFASNLDKRATLGPPEPHVLVAPPRSVFVTLELHLRGSKSDYAREEERMCVQNAPDERAREACED